jgi:FkbM family methyltransferase
MYYSRFGEDRFINESLKPPRIGIFVDVGAGGAGTTNNTLFFEKKGWVGLCIDADLKQCTALKDTRRHVLRSAIAKREKMMTMYKHTDHPTLTTGVRRFNDDAFTKAEKVLAVPLEMALGLYGIRQVDLLSVDVEGMELEVLESFDWEAHMPGIIIVSFLAIGLPSKEKEMREFFATRPYYLAHKTQGTLIFQYSEGLKC